MEMDKEHQKVSNGASDNPFNLKAQAGSFVRSIGLYGQAVSRAVVGVSKLLGFASLGALGVHGIGLMSGGAGILATEGGLLSGLTVAGFPPLAIAGGILVAGYLLNRIFHGADKRLSGFTETPAGKDSGFFNPVCGFANTIESVGLVGKAVGKDIKNKANLGVVAALGLAAVELGGVYLGQSEGFAANPVLGTAASWAFGLTGITPIASPLLIIAGLAVSFYLISKVGKGLEVSIDRMLLSRGKEAKGTEPSPA